MVLIATAVVGVKSALPATAPLCFENIGDDRGGGGIAQAAGIVERHGGFDAGIKILRGARFPNVREARAQEPDRFATGIMAGGTTAIVYGLPGLRLGIGEGARGDLGLRNGACRP